jgi:hypothetical protein
MRAKTLFAIAIAVSLITTTIGQTRKRIGRGALVNKNKPAVFISFIGTRELEPLRTGYGRTHLLFRITNNTQWSIWLDMNGVPKEYGDAGLFYTIESGKDGRVEIDSRCHVCSVNPVGLGRSVLFTIPADYVRKDSRLRIAYSFEWERNNEAMVGSYSIHSVAFYFSYLPKSVLPTETLSNKRLERTRR